MLRMSRQKIPRKQMVPRMLNRHSTARTLRERIVTVGKLTIISQNCRLILVTSCQKDLLSVVFFTASILKMDLFRKSR